MVDASDAVLAVHQAHDYAHVEWRSREAHFGAEAEHNLMLAGGKRRLFTIYDASHRLTRTGNVRRNLGAYGRAAGERTQDRLEADASLACAA